MTAKTTRATAYADALYAEAKAKRTVETDTYALAYALATLPVERFEQITDAVLAARVAGVFGGYYHEHVAALALLLADTMRDAR
jgi:hypothetical protein